MPRWAESLEDVLMSASRIIVGGFAVAIPCEHCLALSVDSVFVSSRIDGG